MQAQRFAAERTYWNAAGRAVCGGLSFASVSVLFSTMALLLSGPAHALGDAQIGLVGLAGVVGALMANLAGRLSRPEPAGRPAAATSRPGSAPCR